MKIRNPNVRYTSVATLNQISAFMQAKYETTLEELAAACPLVDKLEENFQIQAAQDAGLELEGDYPQVEEDQPEP